MRPGFGRAAAAVSSSAVSQFSIDARAPLEGLGLSGGGMVAV